MRADQPVLLIFDVPARPPGGPEQEAALRALAESRAEGHAGGVTLSGNGTRVEACHRIHAERLGRMGITGIEAACRETNQPLSRIDRAPIPQG